VAVDSVGNALSSGNPTSGQGAWSIAHADNSSDYGCGSGGLTCQAPLMGIACPSVTLCAGVDFTGNILQSPSPAQTTPWASQPAEGGGPQSLWSVSCPSTAFCTTVDGRSSNVFSWDPAAGIKPEAHRLPVDAFGIWCRSVSLCLASGEAAGGIAELVGSTNAATRSPTWAVTAFGDVNAVSCPTATTCLAADNQGQVIEGVTTASLSSTLRRQALGGHIPKLGPLVHAGGYTVHFTSPLAGQLSVKWQVGGAVVATASRRFAAPQTRSIRLRLTAGGRALVRGATRIALSAVASYATSTGTVSAQRTLVRAR